MKPENYFGCLLFHWMILAFTVFVPGYSLFWIHYQKGRDCSILDFSCFRNGQVGNGKGNFWVAWQHFLLMNREAWCESNLTLLLGNQRCSLDYSAELLNSYVLVLTQ